MFSRNYLTKHNSWLGALWVNCENTVFWSNEWWMLLSFPFWGEFNPNNKSYGQQIKWVNCQDHWQSANTHQWGCTILSDLDRHWWPRRRRRRRRKGCLRQLECQLWWIWQQGFDRYSCFLWMMQEALLSGKSLKSLFWSSLEKHPDVLW